MSVQFEVETSSIESLDFEIMCEVDWYQWYHQKKWEFKYRCNRRESRVAEYNARYYSRRFNNSKETYSCGTCASILEAGDFLISKTPIKNP
jgi:hypothetical protein